MLIEFSQLKVLEKERAAAENSTISASDMEAIKLKVKELKAKSQ